ncbi:TPA_asm: fiber [Phytophthora water mold MELD virus]|nr:TPA_asm: fiber [Phytophthora water mold MELD virus]
MDYHRVLCQDVIYNQSKMSQPPVIQSSIFNSGFFSANSDPLTIALADKRYLSLGGGVIAGSLSIGGALTVGGSTVVPPPSYTLSITEGTAAPSKALVLDSSSNISGIGSLSATSLTGTLQTAAQPNITSLGTLTSMNVSVGGTNGSLGKILMPSLSSTSACYLILGRNYVADQYARINYYYDSSNTNNNYLSLGHNSANTLTVSNNGMVGINQTIPSCALEVYGSILCSGNLTSTGITLALGSSGSQSLTNNNVRFWGSTLNTQSINLYRVSDTSGLVLASTCSTISSNVAYPLLNLVASDNATSISQLGASATSQSLFQIDWKQSSVSTWSSQTIKHMLDFGNSRNYKSGYPYCHTLAISCDAFCINTLGGTANPPKGCLYLVSGSGATAPDNIDKLLFNTDTPYTNATYGTAGFTCNGNMFIKSNNSFNDGTSSWNMPLCLSNGNVTSELLFAFQMNNGVASTSTNSVVMGTVSNNDLRFMTNNSTRMTITSAGRVGIGITAPLYGLHVTTTATVTIDGGASGVAYFKVSGGLVSTVGPLSSVAVGITCSGALVASTGCYVWSDERLKKDWTELSDDVSDSMLKVKPMLYRYKTDPDSASLQVGYSAQSLLKAGLPHCITFHKSDGLEIEDPETDMKDISYSVDYGKMTCLLHKLVLRQQQQIKELERKISELI